MSGKKGGKWYTNGFVTKKIYEGDMIPEGFVLGVHYKHEAWNKDKTADTDERVKANGQATRKTRLEKGNYVAWNKNKTKEDDPRIKGMSGKDNPMYGKHPKAWNEGKTKDNDPAMKRASDNHKGCIPWNKDKQVGSFWTAESPVKSYETRKANGTLGIHANTKAELDVYENILLKEIPPEDIIQQYIDKNRYPYRCDFYIKSVDKFIEVHANWTHGGKPYDPENDDCKKQLLEWTEKAKTSDYYKNAIYTWTDLDVRKVQVAKENDINLEVIYYDYKKH